MSALQTTFTRTMSLTVHELRTPVTVVSGYLRMLLKEQGGPLTDRQKKMLEEADRSCTRIGALVSEMSDLGKIESGDVELAKQSVDVTALLIDVAGNMHEGENRGVTLELRGVDQPICMTGDRARLTAAFKALVHAALRERGEPGAIVIDCRKTAAGAIEIRIGDEDAQRALTGAPDADHSFDEWRGGMGLALPLARRVIVAHGGAVWSAPVQHSRGGAAVRLPLNT
jgi:signal transduction histidine kinase